MDATCENCRWWVQRQMFDVPVCMAEDSDYLMMHTEPDATCECFEAKVEE